jgi:glycogen synthase
MKVLQLGPYPPPHGGVQTHIVALVDFLRKRGVDCEVMNLTRLHKPSQNGIFYPSNSLSVVWHLLSHYYDVIHLHIGGRIWLRQLGLSLICSMLPRTKCLLTFHSGGYPSSPEGRSADPRTLRGFALRRLDRVIAVNEEIAQFFYRLGIPAQHIRIISPYAVPKNEVSEQNSLPISVAEFFADHHPTLISVGLLEPEYDLALQINALTSIRKKQTKAGLLIVGSGSLEQVLRKQVSESPDGKHILLTGDLENAATLQAIQRSRIMLRTTWYDGDALSVREALHLGTPVIATQNGMRPEGVRLIPTRDLEALIGAVQDEFTSPQVSTPVASPGNRNLDEILSLYQELATENKSKV